ncbi:hypothetical protein SCA03_33770 [Streptomyces cacaoi]|uniref:Uncharacterized protein n=1 Tax=Streptomyces cacaoi TaxID=1898 RepID=A0A4Y3QZK1_STRCI|nr:hypothetical protein SCA03_33770 [Streptomyces cacaoi]
MALAPGSSRHPEAWGSRARINKAKGTVSRSPLGKQQHVTGGRREGAERSECSLIDGVSAHSVLCGYG